MNKREGDAVVEEGARVRLRPGSAVVLGLPELQGVVGVVGSIIHGTAWHGLAASDAERARDTTVHIRFANLNVIALSVPTGDVEVVDHLAPELRVV